MAHARVATTWNLLLADGPALAADVAGVPGQRLTAQIMFQSGGVCCDRSGRSIFSAFTWTGTLASCQANNPDVIII